MGSNALYDAGQVEMDLAHAPLWFLMNFMWPLCQAQISNLPVCLSVSRCILINHPIIPLIWFNWHEFMTRIRLQWPSGSSKARQKQSIPLRGKTA